MEKIKLGIAGIGKIFKFHKKGFQRLENTEIVGACRNFYGSKEKQAKQRMALEQFCKDNNIEAYRNYGEMVTDPGLDAIIITSINPYHYEQIMEAMDHGKHVLVEKPVVTEIDQIDLIKKRVTEKGLVVFPAHNFVYRGAVQKAKEIIDSGKLGEIVYASFISTHLLHPDHKTGWRAKKELSAGGALIDSGHHIVYQSLFLMGMPKKIHGFNSKLVLKNMECEDIAQVNLRYPDDAIGCIMQSWTSRHGQGIEGIRILGTEGNIIISDALYYNGEKIDDDVSYENSFYNQATAFINCIKYGKPPISTLEDVRNSLKIIYGAYESSANDRVIEFC